MNTAGIDCVGTPFVPACVAVITAVLTALGEVCAKVQFVIYDSYECGVIAGISDRHI